MTIKVDDPNYNYAFNVLMDHEGGLSDDPDDSGGLTKYGITLDFLKEHKIDVNSDGLIDKQDILDLELETARRIYFYHFWIEYQYWRINDNSIATKVMDMAVNMGEITAHKLLQEALNNLISNKLVVDGFLGVKTFWAINTVNPRYLHQELRDISKHHYLNIIKNNPKDEKFEEGWLKRAAW